MFTPLSRESEQNMYEDGEIEENEQDQQPGLEPVEQESIAFHGDNIVAVRLADGRIAVVLRWICESLKLRPNGQVNRIKRTAAIANELIRVKVQTRGGRQEMPAVTLRGFPTWVLGINPNEVKEDPEHPEEAGHIRQMIIAYQVEAVDVLYTHFAQKAQRPVALTELAEGRAVIIGERTITEFEPAKPQELASNAMEEELITYYEKLAVWAHWKASQYAQQWRGKVNEWRGAIEARLESREAMTDLIPEILERLGPETLSPGHHRQVQVLAKQLHQATGKPYPTIYDDLKTAFEKPRIEDLLEDDWSQIEHWFRVQIERTKGKPR
jgi:P22_AR N-terminal domain